MAVQMFLGDYEFSPAPQLSISKNWVKQGDGSNISLVTQYTLEGQLFCGGATVCNTGISSLIDQQVAMESGIGACPCCKRFYLACGDPLNTLIDVNVNVASVNYSPTTNNWVQTIDYSLVLESTDISGQDCLTPCLQSVGEQWSLNRLDDIQYFQLDNSGVDCSGLTGSSSFELVHDVTATARECCNDSGTCTPGWEIARDWVLDRLGLDPDFIQNSGSVGLDPNLFEAYNHTRNTITDKTGGTFTVNERWLLVDLPTGIPAARETFSIDIETGEENPYTLVSTRGTITGLESAAWAPYSISRSKYENALDYWNWLEASGVAFCRANQTVSGSVCDLNEIALTQTVSHNPADGVITYVNSYNDRPAKLIAGAKRENISINDGYPVPLFAEIPIIGRGSGPILQDLGTISRRTRSVSIDILYPRQCITSSETSCEERMAFLFTFPSGTINEFLCCIEQDLESNWDIVYKTQDTGSWNPVTGQYTRSVEWTFQDCSGTQITGFC